MEETTLHIKNIACASCITVLKYEFEDLGIETEEVTLGRARIRLPSSVSMETIEKKLRKHGFSLIKDEDEWLVEQIKQAVRELLNRLLALANPKPKNSDFISQKIPFIF